MTSQSKDIDIVMVGKTGNGKSARGNSITGRKSFISKRTMLSVTKESQFEYSEFEGRNLKVVDTPGLIDTSKNEREGYGLVVQAVKQAMIANPEGYHAILIVVRYDERFGEDNVKTVKLLKHIFGEGFIENHGILVFTCGDKFENDDSDDEDDDAETKTNRTFDEWLKQQSGNEHFDALIRECGNRSVLFNNKTKEKERNDKQVRDLIEIIRNLTEDNRRYTNEHFKMAEEKRQEMYADLGRPLLREGIVKKTGLITQKLSRMTSDVSKKNPQDVLDELEKIKQECTELYQMVIEQDKGTGALKAGIKTVLNLQSSINEEIQIFAQLKLNSEKEDELQKEMEKLKLEKEEYEAKKKQDEEELEKKEKELRRKEEERKKEEAERQQQMEEERKRIEEEFRRFEEEKQRAEEEQRKREETQRQRIEEELRILEEQKKQAEDEKAKAELQAQIEAQEEAERQRKEQREEDKKREKQLQEEQKEKLRREEEKLREETERIREEEEQRREKEKKERKEYEARKREQEEAVRKRKIEEQEQMMKQREEIVRLKEENLKAAEDAKKKSQELEREYQQMKAVHSRGLLRRVGRGIANAASKAFAWLW